MTLISIIHSDEQMVVVWFGSTLIKVKKESLLTKLCGTEPYLNDVELKKVNQTNFGGLFVDNN